MDIEIENPISISCNSDVNVESTNSVDVVGSSSNNIEVTFDSNEFSIVGDDMVVVTNYDDAPMWLKNTIANIASIETAIAVGDLETVKESLDVMLGELEVAKNTYELSIISSADIDNRITTAITTLNSSLQEADATILEIAQTATTPAEASAIALNTLNASLSANGAIGSAIHNLESAMATLEGTTAESISYLESTMQGEINGNASAMQTIRTYVGIDEAGASTGTGLSAYLEGSDGTIGSAGSQINNDIRVTAESIESKWAYNSIVNVNGVYKKSGFGLTTNYTSGSGTQVDPYVSEFWIDASRLKFTNSAMTGSKAPFTIAAEGPVPEITFNGKVAFTNVSNGPTHTYGTVSPSLSIPATVPKGSTFYNTTTKEGFVVADTGYWINSSSVTDTSNLALKDMSNVTTIDGGKITTGTIDANRINTTDLFSKNITFTGTITGGNVAGGGIIKSYNGNMVIDLVNGSIYIA